MTRGTSLRRLALLALAAVTVATCGDSPAPVPVGGVIRGAPISNVAAAPAPPAAPLGDVSPPPPETLRVDDVPKPPEEHPTATSTAPEAPPPVPPGPPETAAGPATAPPAGAGPSSEGAPPVAEGTKAPTAAPPPPTTADTAADATGEGSAVGKSGKPDAAAKSEVPSTPAALGAGGSRATPHVLTFDVLAGFEYVPPDPEVAGSEIKSAASIPEDIRKYDGTWVSVDGFMLPLEYAGEGVSSFLLSRHQMGCCFGVLPRPNELIEVEMPGGKIAPYVSYLPVIVTGKLRVGAKEGASTVLSGIYRIDEPQIDIPEQDDSR